jgi:hypothetical protein
MDEICPFNHAVADVESVEFSLGLYEAYSIASSQLRCWFLPSSIAGIDGKTMVKLDVAS